MHTTSKADCTRNACADCTRAATRTTRTARCIARRATRTTRAARTCLPALDSRRLARTREDTYV